MHTMASSYGLAVFLFALLLFSRASEAAAMSHSYYMKDPCTGYLLDVTYDSVNSTFSSENAYYMKIRNGRAVRALRIVEQAATYNIDPYTFTLITEGTLLYACFSGVMYPVESVAAKVNVPPAPDTVIVKGGPESHKPEGKEYDKGFLNFLFPLRAKFKPTMYLRRKDDLLYQGFDDELRTGLVLYSHSGANWVATNTTTVPKIMYFAIECGLFQRIDTTIPSAAALYVAHENELILHSDYVLKCHVKSCGERKDCRLPIDPCDERKDCKLSLASCDEWKNCEHPTKSCNEWKDCERPIKQCDEWKFCERQTRVEVVKAVCTRLETCHVNQPACTETVYYRETVYDHCDFAPQRSGNNCWSEDWKSPSCKTSSRRSTRRSSSKFHKSGMKHHRSSMESCSSGDMKLHQNGMTSRMSHKKKSVKKHKKGSCTSDAIRQFSSCLVTVAAGLVVLLQ